MKAWSNIDISSQDPEIVQINNLEKKLGELPDKVIKIRELITRFEVCHFKYQQHLKIIKDSIIRLEPGVEPGNIGINHVRHGEDAWKKDTTGKSLTGQQYIWAIKGWLTGDAPEVNSENYDKKTGQKIRKWLGEKNRDKIRLVRLLLARLTWDWKSYEKLRHGGKHPDLELQACSMDICHYAFPENLDLLLQGIGQMQPVRKEEFEGCGSYNNQIRAYIETEFLNLNDMLKSLILKGKSDINALTRAWLTACLAKTIKEDIRLSIPIVDMANQE